MILRKILSIIISLCMLILLMACTADIVSESDTKQEIKSSGDLESDNIVVSGDIPDREYFVIRSDYSDREETDAAVRLRKALEENTSASIGILTDWEKNPVYEYEFIVGNTLREKDENVEINRIALGETGFIINVVNNKVYLAGGNVRGTNMAVDYFIEKFITDNSDGEVIIPRTFNYIQYHQYDIPQFYIGGSLVTASHVIQCMDERNLRLAEALQSSIYYKTGLWMEIVTGTSLNGKNAAFVLSDTEPEVKGIYQISVEDSTLIFASSASRGLDTCVESFLLLYINDVFGAYSFESDFMYVDLGDYIIVTMPNENQ